MALFLSNEGDFQQFAKNVAKSSPIAERPTNNDGRLEALTRHLQSRRKLERQVYRKPGKRLSGRKFRSQTTAFESRLTAGLN